MSDKKERKLTKREQRRKEKFIERGVKMDITALVKKLDDLALESYTDHADIEDIHLQANSLLLEFINNEDVITAFCKINKWYA